MWLNRKGWAVSLFNCLVMLAWALLNKLVGHRVLFTFPVLLNPSNKNCKNVVAYMSLLPQITLDVVFWLHFYIHTRSKNIFLGRTNRIVLNKGYHKSDTYMFLTINNKKKLFSKFPLNTTRTAMGLNDNWVSNVEPEWCRGSMFKWERWRKKGRNNGKCWEGHFCESDEVNGMPRQSSLYSDYSPVSFMVFLLVCIILSYIKFTEQRLCVFWNACLLFERSR